MVGSNGMKLKLKWWNGGGCGAQRTKLKGKL